MGIGDFNSGLTKLYKIVDVGGMRIGITSVLGKKEIAGRKSVGDLTLLEPYQAIPRILGELRDKKCDHLVLLANAEPDETKDLARRFPRIRLGDDRSRGRRATQRSWKNPEGANSHLVEVGAKGGVRRRRRTIQEVATRRFVISACRWIIVLPMRRKCSRCRSKYQQQLEQL